MMRARLIQAERRWACPNCDATDVTLGPATHQRFHNCRGLRGLSAPMVEAGTKAKVEALLPEDYIGKQVLHLDGEGTPVRSIVTTRDEGQDCAVLAPVATASLSEG